ncbi:MAG: NnrU family protein [Acetobacteraceae bacterium]|nr:NnrU family protein [Acetobacteraceae bacterium]
MLWLVLASLLWVGVHVGVAGTRLRGEAVARLGEKGFMITFSAASFVSIALLVLAWQNAPYQPLWMVPGWVTGMLALLILPGFWLFVASVASPNPTAAGGKLAGEEPRGVQRITRHPMLWSFSLWAGVHVATNGDVAGLLFFGAFLVTSLVGMPSIDRKLAARDPALWARLAPRTSILPFGAVIAGRNRVALGEIPKLVWIIGTLAWLALLVAHPWIFGVPALR